MQPHNETSPEKVTVKSNKPLVITLIIVIVVLIGGCAALGYFLKKQVDDQSSTKRQLSEQTKIVNDMAQVIRDSKLEPSFRKVLQDNANRECSSGNALLFNSTTSLEKNGDGSTKKYFAISQYFCHIGETATTGPIRFAAAQSYDGITWEFTYGSSTRTPVSLPHYIFDTDPALFNRKYNNPKSF
jgi:type II secretory pathway pseudopilin PulG